MANETATKIGASINTLIRFGLRAAAFLIFIYAMRSALATGNELALVLGTALWLMLDAIARWAPQFKHTQLNIGNRLEHIRSAQTEMRLSVHNIDKHLEKYAKANDRLAVEAEIANGVSVDKVMQEQDRLDAKTKTTHTEET